MKNLGQLLKSEREKKGLSLQEIALSLKINVRILRSIEEGDESQLPARPFLKGFVRSYAQFLKLDVVEILTLLQKEFDQSSGVTTTTADVSGESSVKSAPAKSVQNSIPKVTHDPALEGLQDGPKWYYLVGAGILVLLIVLAIKIIEKYQAESTIAETAVTELQAEEPSTTVLDVLAIETTSTISESPETQQTPMESTSTTLTPTTTLVTTTTVAPTTTLAPTTTTTLAPTTTTTQANTTTSSTLDSRPTEVIVEATSNVTLRFSISNDRWENLTLNPGQIHVFRSRTGVQIEASDGGALKLIVNGRDRGLIGTVGKPARFSSP
jgi:cytoskeleton protein RodZ